MTQLPEDLKMTHDKALVEAAKVQSMPDVLEVIEKEAHAQDFKVGDRVYVHSVPGKELVNLGANSQPGSVLGVPAAGLFAIRLSEPVSLISDDINVRQEIQLERAYLWSEAEYEEYCEANPVDQ